MMIRPNQQCERSPRNRKKCQRHPHKNNNNNNKR